jgi:uncharacterized protein
MFESNLVITPIYAIAFALFFLALSIYVIKMRMAKHVSFGHLGDAELESVIRAHGNFAEYIPVFLILLLLLELNYANPFLSHMLGITMLVGRSLHAYSVLYFERKHNHMSMRVGGMLCTFLAIGLATIYNLVVLCGWV